jgi:ABC-2 type transport system ATP-binding protein
MIKTEGLMKKFRDVVAVDRLDLEIQPGEIFGFLGPNGAGKTTTVKLMTGLLRPTSGRAWVGGFDVQSDPRRAKKIMGLVPDQPYVYPHLTGNEFLRFIGDLYEVELSYQKKKIPELLEMFELGEMGSELVETYSHGMRQKLVLAGVLLHQPKVLFLDEPMVGLDPKSARLVKDVFKRLSENGVTLFMCTHVLEIAERLCHRVGIVQRGCLSRVGTVTELRSQAAQAGSLEDIFLALTGGDHYRDLLKYLSE